jgi:hypothetical protein
MNVVGMFRRAGVILWLAPDERFYCVSQERAQYLITGLCPDEETVLTEDEIWQAEAGFYFERCADTVAEEISSEGE